MNTNFGWSYPAGAANDPYAPYNQKDDLPEWTTASNNTKKIFRYFEAKNWGQVYRRLYNGTDCGVTIGIVIQDYLKPIYCDDLYKHTIDAPVTQINVSSIVEGVENGTETVVVNLTKRGTRKTGNIIKRLFAAVEEVEQEAAAIWNDTHGCNDCGVGEGEIGYPMVNPKCKSCHGNGVVI